MFRLYAFVHWERFNGFEGGGRRLFLKSEGVSDVCLALAHVDVDVQRFFEMLTQINTKGGQALLTCRINTTNCGPSLLDQLLVEVTHGLGFHTGLLN